MKIFALGGYGKVGVQATKLLAQGDLVTGIAIAGRSLERAQEVAAEIGEKAVAVHADGTDEEELTSLLAGYDVIVNAAPDEAVLPTIRAAIRTRTHYCDANTVVGPALRLASEAEAVGITAVVATGYAPCISNLMGVHMARHLEEVEQLQLGIGDIWNFQSGRELPPRQWLEDPRESLAALHGFRPFIAWMLRSVQKNGSRTMCIHKDGRWGQADPVRSGMDVPLTQGGTTVAYPYAIDDPLFQALPDDLSRVPPVEVFFSPLPPQLHALLREHALRVLEGSVDPDTATSSLYDTVESDPHRWLTVPDDFVPVPKMWVRAVGRKQGRAARCTCWFTAPVWNVRGYFLTSVALVVAVRRVLRGEIRQRGVMTAETAFEPLPFLEEVAAMVPDPPPDGRMFDESFEWLE